jgi:hypothetical protein
VAKNEEASKGKRRRLDLSTLGEGELHLGDGLSGVETLGAGSGTVEDGVASVEGEGVLELGGSVLGV